MSGLGTAIRLNDQMSATLDLITQATDRTTASWRTLDATTQSGLVVDGMDEMLQKMDQINESVLTVVSNQQEHTNEINRSSMAADGLLGKIGRIGAALGFAKIAKDAIEFASDLAEVQNVVDVSFAESAAIVDEWATTTLDAFGLNELSAKQYAGTMGAMLKSSGLTGDSVSEMAMRITELAGDMASFYNLSSDEAFAKIRSGISGETEPLKQLGINMSVANLEAFALSQGITTAYEKMTQAEQVTLRYNYLLNAAADSQGDFTRTQGSFANQTKLLTENFKAFTGQLANFAVPILARFFETINNGLNFMINNTDVVVPLLTGLISIVGAYTAVSAAHNGVKAISATLETIHAARIAMTTVAEGAETTATFAATAAQYGFNAALLACPLTWIVLAIIAAVAAVVALANAFSGAGHTAETAFGVIAGSVSVLGTVILDIVIGVVNAAIQLVWDFVDPFLGIIEFIINVTNGGFNSLGDAFANLAGQILSTFLSLGKVVTKVIDAIFGSETTNKLSEWQDAVLSWGKNDNAITIDRNIEGINRIEYSTAYNVGAAWGDSVSNKLQSLLMPELDVPESPVVSQLDAIADDTGYLANEVNVANEDLKYLRDIAERDVINRFTTAEIKVDLGGVNNTVNQNMDLDGMIDYLTDEVRSALEIVREGVEMA